MKYLHSQWAYRLYSILNVCGICGCFGHILSETAVRIQACNTAEIDEQIFDLLLRQIFIILIISGTDKWYSVACRTYWGIFRFEIFHAVRSWYHNNINVRLSWAWCKKKKKFLPNLKNWHFSKQIIQNLAEILSKSTCPIDCFTCPGPPGFVLLCFLALWIKTS